jgi:hypothetical protein
LARPNSHKGGLTPWQIVHQLAPHLPPRICLLPPVFLDYRLDSLGGYDLPRFPYDFFAPRSRWRPIPTVRAAEDEPPLVAQCLPITVGNSPILHLNRITPFHIGTQPATMQCANRRLDDFPGRIPVAPEAWGFSGDVRLTPSVVCGSSWRCKPDWS